MIRLYCPVTEHGANDDGDLGWLAYKKLSDAGVKVRVISTVPFTMPSFAISGKKLPGGRWTEGSALTEPMSHPFINVVVGDKDTAERYYTEGVENVWISAGDLSSPVLMNGIERKCNE